MNADNERYFSDLIEAKSLMAIRWSWRRLAEAHSRKSAGPGTYLLTDSQLANRLDVDERTIRKWKSGQTSMVYTTWCCLCWLAGLGMPLDNIISG
jgi:hypothetical protein